MSRKDGMKVLITGGTGRWGPTIHQAFLENGFDIRLLLHRKKIKSPGANCELVWGDVMQPDSVRQAIEGVDAVVHLAGMVQPFTEMNPELAKVLNVGGTRTVVSIIKEKGGNIPLVFPSSVAIFGLCSDADQPLHCDRNPCNPTTVYAETKVESENLIKESGIDYVILRVTAVPYLKITLGDLKAHLFTVPLKNRMEFCHPDDASLAVVNAIKYFDRVKGRTLLIAGGPSQQMLWEDLLSVVFGTFGLPLPPESKFAREPYPMHWYDTTESEELLQYQHKTVEDYGADLAGLLPSPLIALMRRFIGPVFGRLIVRLI